MSEVISHISINNVKPHTDEKWTHLQFLYGILMFLSVLYFIWDLFSGKGVDKIPAIVWIVRIVSAVFAFYIGKLWQDKGFRILAIYSCLFFFRIFIPKSENLFLPESSSSIFSAAWLFMSCYGLSRVLKDKKLQVFLVVCSTIWILAVTIWSSIGIYAAWINRYQTVLPDNGEVFFGLYNRRLVLGTYSTTSAAVLSISVLVTLVYIVYIKKRFLKASLFLTIVPMIIALALTDSRTGYISVAIGLACIISILMMHGIFIHTAWFRFSHRKILLVIIGLLIAILMFLLVMNTINQIPKVFNSLKTRGVISRAYAEETATEDTTIIQRGFGDSNVLNGRQILWKEVMEYIIQNPKVLLWGESKLSPLRNFDNEFAHCHNIYIQVLLESGIPGLILLFTFLILTAIRGIRVIRSNALPLWMKILPGILVSLWVADLAECFLWLRSVSAIMIVVHFVIAGIIWEYGRIENFKEKYQ